MKEPKPRVLQGCGAACVFVCVSVLLHSLHGELVGSHRYAVHKLHGAPQTVELHTLVHVHHAVAGQRPAPDGVVQEGPHPCEDDLEHGETTAEPLFGQEVALTSDGDLLGEEREMRLQSTAWNALGRSPAADSARQAMAWTYLRGAEALDERNHVQRCVLGFQTLHLSIKTFALFRGEKKKESELLDFKNKNAKSNKIHFTNICPVSELPRNDSPSFTSFARFTFSKRVCLNP